MYMHTCLDMCVFVYAHMYQTASTLDFILDFERMHRLFCLKLVNVLRLNRIKCFHILKSVVVVRGFDSYPYLK